MNDRPWLWVQLLWLGLAGLGWAEAECASVSFSTQERLEMGLLRAQPGATGFITLDPRAGVSVSNSGASHQGPSGPGQVQVQGPAGQSITVGLEATSRAEWNTNALELVELLVRVGADQFRLGLTAPTVTVNMPSQGNEHGMAQTLIEVGAVFRYNGQDMTQSAQYQLQFSCSPAHAETTNE